MLTLIFGLIVIARFIGDAILLGVLIDTELPPSCNEERLKMSDLANNSLKYMLISEPLIWTKLNWDFHVWFTYNMQLIAYLHMNQHFHSRSHSEPTGKHSAMLLYAWCLYDLPEHLSFPLPSRIRNLSQAHVRIISHWLRQLYITSRKYGIQSQINISRGCPFIWNLMKQTSCGWITDSTTASKRVKFKSNYRIEQW